jgi:Ca2+/Na+ antiporter
MEPEKLKKISCYVLLGALAIMIINWFIVPLLGLVVKIVGIIMVIAVIVYVYSLTKSSK